MELITPTDAISSKAIQNNEDYNSYKENDNNKSTKKSSDKKVSLSYKQKLLLLTVLIYIGSLLILPLVGIAIEAYNSGFSEMFAQITDFAALSGLKFTIILTIIAVLVNSVVGVFGAIVLIRHKFIGKTFLDAMVDMPLAISPVMIGLAFLVLFGRDGWFEPILNLIGLKITFAFPGMVIATLFVTFPFVIREVGYVLEELGITEEEAAITLGASPWQTFLYVTLPNIRYALGYGVLLTVARTMGEFGAILVLGGAIMGKTQTATTFIYASLEERMEAGAYAMSILLATISIVLLLVLEFIKKKNEHK